MCYQLDGKIKVQRREKTRVDWKNDNEQMINLELLVRTEVMNEEQGMSCAGFQEQDMTRYVLSINFPDNCMVNRMRQRNFKKDRNGKVGVSNFETEQKDFLSFIWWEGC